MNSSLYVGGVTHRRLRPIGHEFRYSLSTFALDLDELPELDRRLRLFGVNRRAVFAFHDRDHIEGARCSTKEKLLRFLAAHGVVAKGRIVLVTQCRMLGYVFNPVSFFYCHDERDALVAIVAEVHNTFGEQHLYLLDERARMKDADGERYGARKELHVSPFISMDARYSFRFGALGERWSVAIHEEEAGEPVLVATMFGERRPLDDRALAGILFRFPFLTLRIIAAIHWQAARLWWKGVAVHHQPAPNAARLAQARLLRAEIPEEVRP